MKVQLSIPAIGVTGRNGNMVYCYLKETKVTYARRYVVPAETEQQRTFRSIQKNLWRIHPSDSYKNDLRQYVKSFNQSRPRRLMPIHSWCAAWQIMMFEMQRLFPSVDLATITRQQIFDDNLPCINVAAAIDANLIRPIADYLMLTNNI